LGGGAPGGLNIGYNGQPYGGGGSGGGGSIGNYNSNGGAGAAGVVIFEY